MKKIIGNFFIFIAFIILSGCVSEGLRQTYGDEWMEANSDWRSGESTSTTVAVTVPQSDVLSQTVAISGMATNWGGTSDKPVFAIYLLYQEAASLIASGKISNPELMPAGTPCFSLPLTGNLTFSTECQAEDYSIGVYDNIAMSYINGVAVQFDGKGYVTLYLDKTKITLSQVKVYGKDMDGGSGSAEEYISKYGDIDLDKVIPCTVAFAPSNSLYTTIGAFSEWTLNFIIMSEATSFPSEIDKPDLSQPHTYADINYIIGTVVGSWNTNDATSDNLDENKCFYYHHSEYAASDTVMFKYIIAGNGYDYQLGAATKGTQSLGTEILLEMNTNTNDIEFEAEAGKDYVIRYYYDANNAYCIINEDN